MGPQIDYFDIAIIGATNASLAAAAYIKRVGGNAVVIQTGIEKNNEFSSDCPPNFVWRKLDLGAYGVVLEPVDTISSLAGGGILLQTFEDENKSLDAIRRKDQTASELLHDFMASGQNLSAHDQGPQFNGCRQSAFERFAPRSAICGSPLASAMDILGDFFADEEIKAHFAQISLMRFGMAGDEPGSAIALGSGLADAEWRVRSNGNGVSLRKALLRVCEDLSVKLFTSGVTAVEKKGKTSKKIVLSDDSEIIAKTILAADEFVADRLGLVVESGGSLLASRRQTEAVVTITLSSSVEISVGANNGVYFLANGGHASLIKARDAAREGEIAEDLPVIFEASGKTVKVTTRYIPEKLWSEGDWRDWSGQDRQALGSQILDLVAPYITGGRSNVSRIDVTVSTPARKKLREESPLDVPDILIPAPHHDRIAALVNLALRAYDDAG